MVMNYTISHLFCHIFIQSLNAQIASTANTFLLDNLLCYRLTLL